MLEGVNDFKFGNFFIRVATNFFFLIVSIQNDQITVCSSLNLHNSIYTKGPELRKMDTI